MDLGSPIIGVRDLKGGKDIVKDGVVVAEGYDSIVTARTESNQDIQVDDNNVVIQSIFWSTVESVEVTESLSEFTKKVAKLMTWCAKEGGICVCQYGNSLAFGLRNQAVWEATESEI